MNYHRQEPLRHVGDVTSMGADRYGDELAAERHPQGPAVQARGDSRGATGRAAGAQRGAVAVGRNRTESTGIRDSGVGTGTVVGRGQIEQVRGRIVTVTRDVPAEAEELLTREPRIAHLATCHDGRPHVAPLWYNYRAGTVEIATTGRKLTNVRKNPRVAMSIQQDDQGSAEWGVTLRGTASVVEDEDERDAVLRRINRRYGASDDAWEENTPVKIDVASVDYWDYD